MNERSVFLRKLREKREKLASVLQEYTGIRRTVEDLYPDNAHFIYELLQNAEDKGATLASFDLAEHRLVFQHNGTPFNESDVSGITNIGEGTKTSDKEQIGCFGIGFKSVFAYTDSPEIYCPTFCFRIDQFVLPNELSDDFSVGDSTRFVLPFNSSKKNPSDAFKEIQTGLCEISEVTLLFLSCLEEIHWGSSIVRRIKHSETHYEVRKEVSNRVVGGSHFLRFSELASGLQKQFVRIAYPIQFVKGVSSFDSKKPLDRQMQIVCAKSGIVAVSFPCAKESSGLRFHLHAPFVPELSRASVKETVVNNPLFDQLAKLSASSLHTIKELGLLTDDFLAVLPNAEDSLPERYARVREEIIAEMNLKPLTPSFLGGHAPASHLLQGRATLKSLLDQQDLRFVLELADDESFDWAANAPQKNSLQDKFLSSLRITEWDIDELARFLQNKAGGISRHKPDERFVEWMNSKSDEWMQSFYAALDAQEDSSSVQLRNFGSLAIVRLTDNKLGTGKSSYFPSDAIDHGTILPRVKRQVFSSGSSKKQQDSAKRFLANLGVRVVGEREEVAEVLKSRYGQDEVNPKNNDLKRFIALVESDIELAKLFKGYSIFECEDGRWRTPSNVFLDTPILETGLSAYYNALGKNARRYPLALRYASSAVSTKRFVDFAEWVGVVVRLQPVQRTCDQNPEWATHLQRASGERSSEHYRNIDFQIPFLAELLVSPSIELSSLVWKTMCNLPSKYHKAEYRVNRSGGSRTAMSQLIHTLRKANWIPQVSGKNVDFVPPLDADSVRLPQGFAFDRGQDWLQKVEFGQGEKKRELLRDSQFRKQLELAKQIGVSIEVVSRLAEIEQNKKSFIDVLDESSIGSDERSKKLGSRTKSGAKRDFHSSDRQVRKKRVPADEVFRYLSSFYLIEDRWHCQMCCDPMPFRKRDGLDCHEKRELFNGTWAKSKGLGAKPNEENLRSLPECEKLYLLLCPLCNSLYNEYVFLVPDEQEALYQWIRQNDESARKYLISCSKYSGSNERDRTIQFHRKHLGDVQAILNAFTNDT